MIKINLAKTHNYTSAGTQTAIAMDQTALRGGDAPHPAVKVAAMVILTILLWGYESYNLGQLKIKLGIVNEQVTQIEQEVAQFGAVKNVVDALSKEKARLDEQLSVIERISQKRAFKLKAIRQVQESVLEDLWLSEMVIDKNILIFKGYSRTPTSVQQIVKNLNKADFIQTAINKELKRVQIGKDELNSFDIEARMMN